MTDLTRRFAEPLPHPGELLREDYLPAYNLTAGKLARAMGLASRSRVERLVRGEVPVDAGLALRLAAVFGSTPQLWMNLQAGHDLSREEIASREALQAIEPVQAAA